MGRSQTFLHSAVYSDQHINLWGFPYPKPCGVHQISSVHISVIADKHINLWGFPYPKPCGVLQISSVYISVIADKHMNLGVILILNRVGYFRSVLFA